MAFVQLIIGFILFVLGIGYLFRPQLILRLNAFIRDNFLKDSIVLLSHRRIGMMLLLLSFILIAMTLKVHP
jgi:hypothetical protein